MYLPEYDAWLDWVYKDMPEPLPEDHPEVDYKHVSQKSKELNKQSALSLSVLKLSSPTKSYISTSASHTDIPGRL